MNEKEFTYISRKEFYSYSQRPAGWLRSAMETLELQGPALVVPCGSKCNKAGRTCAVRVMAYKQGVALWGKRSVKVVHIKPIGSENNSIGILRLL